MGPGQNFLSQVRSCQFFVARVGSGRVSHLWFGFEFGKFPLKMSNSGRKVPGSEAGRPLIYCGSKVSSGWVRGHL